MNRFFHFISRHKYLVTFLFFAVLIGVLDSYSYYQQWKLRRANAILREQICELEKKDSLARKQLNDLHNSQDAVERVARVELYMHTPDEDVYIIKEKEATDAE